MTTPAREPSSARSSLWAISDLHVSHRENRCIVESLHPPDPDDWLIVAGDVAERVADIQWALGLFADRFARVVWAPGNHELWTHSSDEVGLRGEARYLHLVRMCRRLGVVTPEDPYPVWTGQGGPVTVAPLFVGYDYTFRPAGARTKEQGLAYAQSTGVVCSDEFLLHSDPYPGVDEWCRHRAALTERRLADCSPDLPLVLVNHYPLVRAPTRALRHPELAQWCGTEATAQWHRRFNVVTVVYGHLHIPRTTWHDGVRFEEVSLGHPVEWRARPTPPGVLRRVLLTGSPETPETTDSPIPSW
ncbi:metallophosphoesterase family protein [Streptomyces sp. CoH17]|uniref:metallophosphoesterase family protein n=1 Tax=Streptomyces sp. CoH17 TaxID=2992806 RepID=UPI00226DBC56|nr:metallophosphoesterase [Streptomyces sp. CoH17]